MSNGGLFFSRGQEGSVEANIRYAEGDPALAIPTLLLNHSPTLNALRLASKQTFHATAA